MPARRRKPAKAARDPFDPFDGPAAASLDLHGFQAAEAAAAVQTFLEAARRRYPGQLVHIITGKGRGSAGAPVLLPRVRTLLRSGTLPGIEAWSADLDGGGFLVRLRSLAP